MNTLPSRSPCPFLPSRSFVSYLPTLFGYMSHTFAASADPRPFSADLHTHLHLLHTLTHTLAHTYSLPLIQYLLLLLSLLLFHNLHRWQQLHLRRRGAITITILLLRLRRRHRRRHPLRLLLATDKVRTKRQCHSGGNGGDSSSSGSTSRQHVLGWATTTQPRRMQLPMLLPSSKTSSRP